MIDAEGLLKALEYRTRGGYSPADWYEAYGNDIRRVVCEAEARDLSPEAMAGREPASVSDLLSGEDLSLVQPLALDHTPLLGKLLASKEPDRERALEALLERSEKRIRTLWEVSPPETEDGKTMVLLQDIVKELRPPAQRMTISGNYWEDGRKSPNDAGDRKP